MVRRSFQASCVILLITSSVVCGADPELVSLEKIWDRGEHNAFTDLIRWREKWYCTFRESEAHVGGDGQLRVLESTDPAK